MDRRFEEIGRLLEEKPGSFSLFQAIRLLERLHPEREGVGRWGDPGAEVVRFAVPPSFVHPGGEIDALDPGDEEGPARMRVNVMGLTGPLGVLPHEYTSLAADRSRNRDHALRDFLDLFHHRLLSLFYLAWRKSRSDLHYEDSPEGGGVPRHLLDLLGLGMEAHQDRQAVPDETLVHYGGLLAPQPRGAVALRQLLEDRLGVPVEVEEFVGGWFPLATRERCHLGTESDSTRLGRGAVVGDEVWDQQSRVRLRMGPLERDDFDRLLPGGDRHEELKGLVRFFSHDHFDFELQLILRKEDVTGVRLGVADGDEPPESEPQRLGWGSWLRSRERETDGDETILAL
jgi:type VI secretion system protein ImpH